MARKMARTMTLDGCRMRCEMAAGKVLLTFEQETYPGPTIKRVVIRCSPWCVGDWARKVGVVMEKAVREAEQMRDSVCRSFQRGKEDARA